MGHREGRHWGPEQIVHGGRGTVHELKGWKRAAGSRSETRKMARSCRQTDILPYPTAKDTTVCSLRGEHCTAPSARFY